MRQGTNCGCVAPICGRPDGRPARRLTRAPRGCPPSASHRWMRARTPPAACPATHAHDFLALFYLEHGDHALRVDGRDRRARPPGDAFVVAPGTVVAPAPVAGDAADRPGWMVFFPADAVDPAAAAPPGLLAHAPAAVAVRREPPRRRRSACTSRPTSGVRGSATSPASTPSCASRRDGYADAARAHLTLLLVQLGRLHSGRPRRAGGRAAARGGLRRHRRPLPRADLAARRRRRRRAHHRAPHHRRSAGAPAAPSSSGSPSAGCGRRGGCSPTPTSPSARSRIASGYREAGYFVRRFRAAHGVTPRGLAARRREPA